MTITKINRGDTLVIPYDYFSDQVLIVSDGQLHFDEQVLGKGSIFTVERGEFAVLTAMTDSKVALLSDKETAGRRWRHWQGDWVDARSDGRLSAWRNCVRTLNHGFAQIGSSFRVSEAADEPSYVSLMDELITHSVTLRDRGEVKIGLCVLTQLWRLAPTRRSCLEVVCILALNAKDGETLSVFARDIPSDLKNDKHIALLLGIGQLLVGRLHHALDYLAPVSHADTRYILAFDQARRSANFQLITAFVEGVRLYGVSMDNHGLVEAARTIHTQLFAGLLREAMSSDEFGATLRELAFLRLSGIEIDRRLLVDALTSDPQPFSNEPTTVRWLIAVREIDRAKALVQRIIARGEAPNGDFVRSLYRLYEVTGEPSWLDAADKCALNLAQRVADGSVSLADSVAEQVRVSEACARAQARNVAPAAEPFANVKPLPRTAARRSGGSKVEHVFVGFFGQLRFADLVFPELISHLRREIDATVPKDALKTFAVSTWEESGEGIVGLGATVTYLWARMPMEIVGILSKRFKGLIADLELHFPHVVRRLLSNSGSSRAITPEYLRSLTDQSLLVDTAPDAQFREDLGAEFARHPNLGSPYWNQGRMWNRIGALRGLIDAAEKDRPPVSHAIFIRGDLRILGGSPARLLSGPRVRETNWLCVDYDPDAEFGEGFGDRYMVGDRPAIERIMDGERLLRGVLRGNDDLYMSRIGCHHFLSTILCENDTITSSIGAEVVNIEIFRGRRRLSDISEQLAQDIENLSDPELANELRAALG